MTPDQISTWLGANLHRMDGPTQYLGDEPNAPRKDWDAAQVRWLIAASWPALHAAGNQSIPAVCQTINALDYALADRWYLPETPRDFRLLEKAGVPVFGIESKHEMKDFDVVGTSISYTVLLMNFCRYLTASGIPLRWRDRERNAGDYPMVIIGGQAFCAPGAFEPVADCVFLGEAEDEEGNGGLGAVCKRIAAMKDDGMWKFDRLACYEALAREFNYLYFPRFVQVDYHYEDRGLPLPSKQVSGYRSVLAGQRMPFRARHVIDMDAIAPLVSAPLLFANCSMGLGDMEVGRGCPAWCSFCRLSWITKPYRQRTVDMSVRHAAEWRLNMGSNELSPFSPDFPMHTRKKALLQALLENVSDEIDTTAMRVDDFSADNDYVLLQAFGGADAVTLGLEGNSQRMRDLVGKGTSDADVLEAFTAGIRAGFRKFKFFMITNFPDEQQGDVIRIVRLGRKLAELREKMGQPNVLIQFSWTPLLIEAQTPFQWFAPTAPDHTLIDVGDALRDLKIQFKIGTKAEPNKTAFFQLAQRASRDIGEAIVDVLGDLNTACWGGVPKDMKDRLDAAMKARGFLNGLEDAFGERFEHDLFGWEFIDTGVAKSLMWTTYAQMVEFLEGTDADTYDSELDSQYHGAEWVGRCDTTCLGRSCGACSHADLRKRTGYIRAAREELQLDLSAVRPVDLTTVAQRVRVAMVKHERYRQADASFWRALVRRAAYRASHELGDEPWVPNIAKRSLLFASDQITVKDWAGGADYLDFGVTRRVTPEQGERWLAALQSHLQPWAGIHTDWLPYPVSAPLSGAYTAFYEIEAHADLDTMVARCRAWDDAETVPLKLAADSSFFGLTTEAVDAKELLSDLWVEAAGSRLFVHMLVNGQAGGYQVYGAFAGTPGWLEHASRPLTRVDWFDPADAGITALECENCGRELPRTPDGTEWTNDLCMRCSSQRNGFLVAGLRSGYPVR